MIRSLTLAVLIALTGCGGAATSSFAPAPEAAAPTAKTAIRIGTMRGPSNRAARTLKDALESSLARQGLAVVKRRDALTLELVGELAAMNEGNVMTYTWEWRLSRGGSAVARPIRGFERVAGSSSDQWSGLAGENATRIADRVARKVAIALQR